MANTILIVFLVIEFLFLVTGALILAVSLIFKSGPNNGGPLDDAASSLLLQQTPLAGGVANAVFIFITFALSIPGAFMRENKGWLRIHSYMVLACALFTMGLGLDIWFSTLQMRANLNSAWGSLPTADQSMLQQEFQCCGYLNAVNPPFIQDNTCTSLTVAEQLGGCVTPFSSFANQFLDIVFTAMFGGAGLDLILFFATIVVLKDRDEKKRYKLIDEKLGFGAL